MIKPLTDSIKKYIYLTDQNIADIKARAIPKTFHKGDYLLQIGEISKEVCFIFTGVLRAYYLNNGGNKITYMFVKEGELFTEATSFYKEAPSTFSLKAEIDTEVVLFPKSSWQELSVLIKDWEYAMKRLSQDWLTQKLQFQRLLIDQDAKTAYKFLLENEPTIALRVPSNHLASYMGITKHSLSRVRKKIASENRS